MFVRKPLLLLGIAIALVATVIAQSGSPLPAPVPRGAISIGFGPAANMIPSVKNAPFSGVVTSEIEQTLSDGTHINRENREIVMRDSQGRIYRERTIQRVGAPEHMTGKLVTIMDPTQHIQYLCTPLKICRTLRYEETSAIRRQLGQQLRKDPNLTIENLGTSTIDGIEVQGQRITRVVPEGTMGNDRPFTTTDETWRSQQLDIDIQVKRFDPRGGTRTVRMTDIIAGEPDAKYFQVPEGYRVEPMGHMLSGPLAPNPQDGESRFLPLPPSQ